MYLTEAYLQSVFGTGLVAGLSPSASELAAAIELAEADVESALQSGGYTGTYPSSVYSTVDDVPKQIKLAAAGAWWMCGHAVRGIAVPEPAPANIRRFTDALAALVAGTLEVVGVSRSTRRATGGVSFTESDPASTTSKPQIFGRGGTSWDGW